MDIVFAFKHKKPVLNRVKPKRFGLCILLTLTIIIKNHKVRILLRLTTNLVRVWAQDQKKLLMAEPIRLHVPPWADPARPGHLHMLAGRNSPYIERICMEI